jgi:FkbM family methyltransferase
MPPHSFIRRVFKRTAFSIVPEQAYQFIQAGSKAWDIARGSWYEPELDLIPYGVRAGESALDVGANYGLYSYHLSRAVHPSGKVYAFEPVPFTSATFSIVSRLLNFRNVELVPKGCSDRSGTVAFTVPIQEAGCISAGQAYVKGRLDDRPGKEKQVRWGATRDFVAEVVVLDEFLEKCSNLTFFKCDVEGFELPVFRGALRLIERHRPTVVCEINPWFLQGFQFCLSDLVGFFTDMGYTLYRYMGEGTKGRLNAVHLHDIVEDNYVFIHPRWRPRFAHVLED